MSPMNLSTKIYEMGEVKFDKSAESESTAVASNMLNDILESAMDIAINKSMESQKMNIIDELQDEYPENCSEIKDIIEGLSKINIGNMVAKTNAEEPVSLDVEMKRLLNEMMSPPFEIVNYESLPRKDGVGDQPTPPPPSQQQQQQHLQQAEREIPAPPPQPMQQDNAKAVEKKSRVTDLVMNSKKVLNNLLDEEGRKRLEEWEENNEHVIQVIELQETRAEKDNPVDPENVPLPHDDDEDSLLKRHPDDELMDSIQLNAPLEKAGEGDVSGGSNISKMNATPSQDTKKKKWHFSFKFFGFRKNREKQPPQHQTLLDKK